MVGKWPTGIRPRGRGLQVRIWQSRKLVYQTTLECDPFDPVAQAAAVKHREYKLARLKLGLPLRDERTEVQVFRDVASRWLASLQTKKRTVRDYYNILNRYWMPAFGTWPITEITTAKIREKLASFGVSIKTQQNLVGPLSGVLKHGDVSPNPTDALVWPRNARRSGRNMRRHRYSIDERQRLLSRLDKMAAYQAALAQEKPTHKSLTAAHWSQQAALYFRILFAFGPRPGEALALTARHYDGEFMWIEAQYTRGEYSDETKTGKNRMAYVPKDFRPYLDNHPARFTDGPFLTGFRGGPLKDTKRLNPWWKKAHDKERIPYRDPYTCRHTRAAELLSQGVGAAEGAYELGHSIQMFLEIYSEFIEEYRGERDWTRFEIARAA